MFSCIKNKIVLEIINISVIYLLWCFVHNLSIYIYYDYCVPKTIYGYIYTPFYIEFPYCKMLHWTHNTSINGITSINYTIITWITTYTIKNLLIKK